MVSIPSPSFSEGKLGAYVEKKMEHLGYDRVFSDRIGNVVGVMYGREYNPTLLLISHLDTYRKTELDDSCGMRIDGERIYGIGTSDCKAGLAAQIYAGKLLKECLNSFNGNLVVIASVAENNGCSIGVSHFLKSTMPSLGLQASFAVLGEPTDLGLYYGHDGWISVNIKLESKSPEEIKGASEALFSFLSKEAHQTSPTASITEASVEEPRFSRTKSGSIAVIEVDRRLRTKAEAVYVLRRVRNTAHLICKPFNISSISIGIERVPIEMENVTSINKKMVSFPWMTDPLNPFFEKARLALRTAGCSVKGGSWTLSKLRMGTAGSVVTERFGIPVIGYGPGCEAVSHEPDEYVEIENIKEAYFGTAAIAAHLIGITSAGNGI